MAQALLAAGELAITTHVNPDADGIGSALALAHALRRRGLRPLLYSADPVPRSCQFMPGVEGIVQVADAAAARALPPVETLVAVDCGAADRIGDVAELRHSRVLVIDHHVGRGDFGDHRLVRPRSECTARLIDEVVAALELPRDATHATCCFAGLVFDTGRFMHANTGPETFRLAAALADTGIDIGAINRALSYTRCPDDLAREALAIERLRVDADEPRLAGIALDAAALERVGRPDDWGETIEIPRSLAGVEIAYLMREAPDRASVRCSLRCNPPWVVRPVAEHFGGGGHDCAAGCTIEGDLDRAREHLLPALRAAFGSG